MNQEDKILVENTGEYMGMSKERFLEVLKTHRFKEGILISLLEPDGLGHITAKFTNGHWDFYNFGPVCP